MSRRSRRGRAKRRQAPSQGGAAPDGLHQGLSEVVGLVEAGRLKPAARLCERLQGEYPASADPLNLMSLIAHRSGRTAQAATYLEQAVALEPGYAEAHFNLGNVYQELGRPEDALSAYETAVGLRPDYGPAQYARARLLHAGGDLEGAAEAFTLTAGLSPNDLMVHIHLGNVLEELGRLDEAAFAHRQALVIDPTSAVAHHNLGVVLERGGRLEEAEASYRQSVACDPKLAAARNSLGSILKARNNWEAAIESYGHAVELDPDFAEAHANLANAYREQGRLEEARESFDRALALQPDHLGWRVRSALMLPVIPKSVDEITGARDRFGRAVEDLRADGLQLDDPYRQVGMTNFYLSYHELDDRPLQEAVAAMYLDACPGLAWTAPQCGAARTGGGRIKVGFISTFLRNHTIGKLQRGFIANLSRDTFEVVVFRPAGYRDAASDEIDRAADKVVPFLYDLEPARRTIAEEAPDILFYTDIGMDPFTYFLAYARLAPVQMTTWGHPETTGIPNMDYFLSSQEMETPGSQTYYSERLIAPKYLTTFYHRPPRPERSIGRDAWKLPEGKRVYVCPQTLFKLHPDFDPVLRDLLDRDRDGVLALIDDPMGGHWRRRLLARFETSMPDLAERVIFLPKMDLEHYFALLMTADAVLDAPTFSGGNSSLEAFAMGVPIVSWPGRFLRGRITHACYRQMGIGELTVDDGEAYVDLALKLAQDADFYEHMAGSISEKSDILYENKDMLKDFEDFLEAAHGAAGGPPVHWPPARTGT